MDLRSLLVNPADDGDRPPEKPAPPTPHAQPQQYPPQQQQQQQHHHPHHQQQGPPQTPTTPGQSNTSYAFRESAYSHALHASPGKPPAPQEYAVHSQAGSGSYPPQSPYQTPGQYPGRPPQPPLQTQYGNDPRSPGGAPVPAPSPYRQAHTPSTSGPGSGYPFPQSGHGAAPSHEAIASPVQRHQYPPANSYPPRDSYSHASGTPLSATGPPLPGGPYAAHQQHQQQSHHPMPQTPPVGASGGSHPFLHQRSQSTHSTPTPTSAQSQHPYGQPYPRGSPVAASHPPPVEYNRQQSQPPTPLGPPLSTAQRQSSTAPNNFAQPSSPYQQRMSTTSTGAHQPQATPPLPQHHTSQRASTSQTPYDNHTQDLHRRSQSNSEREKSVSVSPKTRVPSLPSSTGGHPSAPPSVADTEMRHVQPSMANLIESNNDRATTPGKRKLADRDLSPRELEKTEARPPPGQLNGGHTPAPRSRPAQSTAPPSPVVEKKRKRYASVPIWAQKWSQREGRRLHKANFELQQRGPPGMNGKHEAQLKKEVKQEHLSRHGSPETTRMANEPSANNASRLDAVDLLGPWEPCITGVKPFEEVSKAIADFIFVNVVSHPESGEIMNRGVQFEIEAKLGTIINKGTSQRVEKDVTTECVLDNDRSLAFKSSMTAAQHKGMNDWLNEKVVNTNPQNPDPKARGRVQVQYKHRRERDKFYELPDALQGRLPGCVRALIQSHHTAKVRVTYDQKTGNVLNKITKVRIDDLDLHLPRCRLDCRISINLEAAWDGDVEELEQLAVGHNNKFSDRSKDRLSYTQSHYQIDLTQVTQQVPGPNHTIRVQKEHELEIELSPDAVLEQGRRALNGQPHRYGELVEGFVDNIRILARTANEYV